ncbi:MAG: alpha-D-ribose 1-methylphosphonate 5-phosphate C-P-lyase PhnJ, partial [Nostoc sp. C3-bin3]|nr:alpha-D-ribose 1-methylphosphonate 5-phosphate C-P-lyase PhnJ [Nostoc sp. C3-bin3]
MNISPNPHYPLSPKGAPSSPETGFNFAYLDEQTKRSIRRALLKAVAIP